eukprot:jgi/Mesen1/9151/ME000587S08647
MAERLTGKRNSRYSVAATPVHDASPGVLCAPNLPMMPSLGPCVQVQANFAEQNSRRIVLALESGMRGEVAWALNALTVLTFAEKDDPRRDAGPLAKVPSLLDALLTVVDDWRDYAEERTSKKLKRMRSLGAGRAYTGFGTADGQLDKDDPLSKLRYPFDAAMDHPSDARAEADKRPRGTPLLQARQMARAARAAGGSSHRQSQGPGPAAGVATRGGLKSAGLKKGKGEARRAERQEEREEPDQDWWWEEEGLFNLDELGRMEMQQCAVAASNVVRNLSFVPENEAPMAAHKRLVESLFVWMEDHQAEDDELVTNAVETLVNLSSHVDLRTFATARAGDPGDIPQPVLLDRVLAAWEEMLSSPVRAWHAPACEALGRCMINPDNEVALVPFGTEVLDRLVDLLASPDLEVQAASVAAVGSYADLASSTKLHLAAHRWAVSRLLAIVRRPHPLLEVCRRAITALESIAQEQRTQPLLQASEGILAELAFSENKVSDGAARVLFELSADMTSRNYATKSIWGA